jgi:hypothetical protein
VINTVRGRYFILTRQQLDVLFVGKFDEEASPLGAKGLGELTAMSVARHCQRGVSRDW